MANNSISNCGSSWCVDEDAEPFGTTLERAAAKYLSRFRWYAPYQNWTVKSTKKEATTEEARLLETVDETPSLCKAWYYFEHMVLPRRYCTKDGDKLRAVQGGVIANSGETGTPTKLYDPCSVTTDELSDFGIGIGLYFSTLKGFSFIFLIAFMINLPNYCFFRSSQYSHNGQSGLGWLRIGSALCTDYKWVPCPNCFADIFGDGRENSDPSHVSAPDQLLYTSRIRPSQRNKKLLFAQKNVCGSEIDEDYLYWRGMVNWVGTVFVVTALIAYGEYERRLAVVFDERHATASDFSITIKNPPKRATDPDEWKRFLEGVVTAQLSQGKNSGPLNPRDTHVTLVTVALNNWQLMDALVARRRLERAAYLRLGMNKEEFEKACDGGHQHKIFVQARKLGRWILQLEKKNYKARRIFVTFETEIGQRAALTALNVSKLDIWLNKVRRFKDERFLFHGKHRLDAEEPTEPLTIRWRDLGIPWRIRLYRRILTSVISLLLVIGAFSIVRFAWVHYGSETSALLIVALNALTPPVCRLLSELEVHKKEGTKQASHSLKVFALRCINSAVIIHVITPFAWSLEAGNHLIKTVADIFFAEMLTVPLLQVLDIPGLFKRHILAPRCRDQESMNLNFVGARWELSERYTNMMKTCFLCFFFSTLYPQAFGLTALLLFIHYQADKYCLLRNWARAPSFGSQIAKRNRSFTVPLLLVTFATMNAFFWSGFPYDDLCPSNDPVPESYLGEHILVAPGGGLTAITIASSEQTIAYEPCNQDFLAYSPMVLLPLPMFQEMRWMSDGQEAIVHLHCWTSLVVAGIALSYVLFDYLSDSLTSIFRGNYHSNRDIYGTDLSDIPGSVFSAYVPQIKVKGFRYPLIACDIRKFDKRFIGWLDEDGDPSEHVLFDDLAREVTDEKKPIFSIMKHWAPPDRKINN